MEVEENYKMSLKLLVDTNSNKVLFAEASKDFVDFLFQIQSLPIAAIIKPLITTFKEEDMAGCLGSLYKSIDLLSPDYMQPHISKNSVLNPPVGCSPYVLFLKYESPSNNNTSPKKFYACSTTSDDSFSGFSLGAPGSFSSQSFQRSSTQQCNYVCDVPGTVCPGCNKVMSREMKFVAPKRSSTVDMATPSSSTGGYVEGVVTYMVMDNLEVKPMSTISAITLVNKFHVKDITVLVEKHVAVGFTKAIAILKAALETRSVLTSVFLGNKV